MASEHNHSIWAVYDLPRQDRSRSASTSEAAEEVQRLLLRNGEWFCSLRWLVIAAFCILALAAALAGDTLARHGIYLTPGWPSAVAGVLAIFNVGYVALARGMRSHPTWRGRLARADLWLQILFDLAVLTVVVHYVGSMETYAPMMYLFHIVLACIFYPPGQSLLVTLSAMGMYLACVVLESTGVVARQSLWAASLLPEGGAGAADIAGVARRLGAVHIRHGLVSRLAPGGRAARARAGIGRGQSALGGGHGGAHPLHAPHDASTEGPLCGDSGQCAGPLGRLLRANSRRRHGLDRADFGSCDVLSKEITEMLQLANLRSSAQDPPARVALDLPALIRACLANLKPEAARRGIALEEELAPATVCGVRDHLVILLDNLLSNAVHYSRDGQSVWVTCLLKPDGRIAVVVRDQGIGIPAEKLPFIFDDYFRTSEAAAYNKASTGLGLALCARPLWQIISAFAWRARRGRAR